MNRLFAVGDEAYEAVSRDDILEAILNTLDDLVVDIKSSLTSLADLSLDFIHSDELIMTSGYSKAVYHFLRVIVSCQAVYPDGTLKATVGTYGAMLAAKSFSIPIYVCLPHYKLSPIPFKLSSRSTPSFSVQPTANPSDRSVDWLDSPSLILPPNDPELVNEGLVYHQPSDGPVVWVPKWEIIPSGLVSLFLTNLGTHAPSYLYALGRELFHSADIKTTLTWT
ncbi:unnamed protein product [Trichobilharzia regenti]|nr:unnamed protein product [Trichobilharzia regenti]